MRSLFLALALAACASDGSLSPQGVKIVGALCAADPAAYAAGQGVATFVPVPAVQTSATLDAALVHPAVVQACAQIGQKPVGATPASPVTPATKP